LFGPQALSAGLEDDMSNSHTNALSEPAGAPDEPTRETVVSFGAVRRAFRHYFRVVPATSVQLRDAVYRIRYAVYCEELGWEPKAQFPDGREKDAYDDRALHCLLQHRPSGRYIGCVRLVLVQPSDSGAAFPFERVCGDRLYPDAMAPLAARREELGEISRLAVISQFRRRRGEQGTPEGMPAEEPSRRETERRMAPHVALCLSLAAAASGLRCGLTGVFALMEPRLRKRLGAFGFHFQQIGEPVPHRGLRIPYFISRDDLYAGLPPAGRALLEVIDEDLSEAGAEAVAEDEAGARMATVAAKASHGAG
jgi:N-acyl amino acid synthase of PEP-CTERM/exosortase system